jgi:hypothetical protein
VGIFKPTQSSLSPMRLQCLEAVVQPCRRWLAYGISLHHLSIRASIICQSPADQLVGMSSRETPRGSSTAGSWLETLNIAANTVAPMPQKKPKSQNRNSVIASPLAIHVSNIHRTFSGALYSASRVSRIELAAKPAIAWSAASMTNRPLGEGGDGARWNSAGRRHGAEVSGQARVSDRLSLQTKCSYHPRESGLWPWRVADGQGNSPELHHSDSS